MTDDPVSTDLVTELRQLAEAYPDSIFGPVSPEEVKEHASLITRNSAAMGRHFSPWFTRAADEMEAQTLRLNSYRQWLVDRVAWLKYEMDHGGDWKYLNEKREETAYCLEKFDALTALRENIDGK